MSKRKLNYIGKDTESFMYTKAPKLYIFFAHL